MANVLARNKQIAVLSALVEGDWSASMRAPDRRSPRHDPASHGACRERLLDSARRANGQPAVQAPGARRALGFVGEKQRQVEGGDDPSLGDTWTYVAIDAETKLVPTFMTGKRDEATTRALIDDLAHVSPTACRSRGRSSPLGAPS